LYSHPIHSSFGPHESVLQKAPRSVQPFCRIHRCAEHRQTDTRHFVTQRPSDIRIQRPGDPVDPVNLLTPNVDLCCRQTFAMGKMFASFYHCLAFARFWKVKFGRSFIKCQYSNDVGRIFTKIYIFISFSWTFFENRKKLGLIPGQNVDPVTW